MNTEHNYLIHWLKKGEKARYIDKVKLPNGRWRYFYTQAEIDAYKKGLSKSASSIADKAKQGLHNLKEGAASAAARGVVNVTSRNERLRSMLGGSHQENARGWAQRANQQQAYANSYNASAHKLNAYAASNARKPGYETRAQALRDSANMRFDEAERYARNASANRSRAADEQKAYDRSIVGRAENRVAADKRRANNEKNRPVPIREAVGKAIDRETSLRTRATRAASKVKEAVTDRAAEALVSAASKSKTVRNATGGKHEDNSREWGKRADASQRRSQAADRKAHQDSAAAARQDRKYGSGGDAYRRSAQANREEAESAASNASALRSKSAAERKEYEQSLLGRAQARVNRKKSRR